MPYLDIEPPAAPKNLDELFALAHAMESDAADRYAAFARLMAEKGRADLAEVFAAVAAEERGHVAAVDAWSRSRLGHAPQTGLATSPALPVFEEESEAEIAGSALMTAYRALSIAVRNEERAFVFWTYLAANADREDVREAAERMASEELSHAALFRRERRKAYRREREAGTKDVTAAQGERRLAGMAGDLGQPLAGEAWPPVLADLSARVADAAGAEGVMVRVSASTTLEQLAEELADAYVAAAASGVGDGQVWQDLAERAIRRIAALRSASVTPAHTSPGG